MFVPDVVLILTYPGGWMGVLEFEARVAFFRLLRQGLRLSIFKPLVS